ncbi:MAG: hypothetical protein WCK28_20515 [Burkholderiales bacterium]|jgi:isopropylmalate/homocitrate/citramalate synthase
MSEDAVLISEVGPRDDLQSVAATMPTAAKCAWIDALRAAGLREIEVGSFVPARLLPQMADVADVVRHALANCLAAHDVGVRTFDASQAGLGGCPDAPGASGNVVTEDLVFMFESMGVRTGVDLGRLIAARDVLRAGLPGEPLYGMTPDAGLPPGWAPGGAAAR